MNKYIFTAILSSILITGSYIINFYLKLNGSISKDTAVWGQFGDYIGGLLNPTLSFLTFIIVIRTLKNQMDSNIILKEEVSKAQQLEKLKSFENHFFNMIKSQSMSFLSFQIEINENNLLVKKSGTEAVIWIEDEIEKYRDSEVNSNELIINLLTELDEKDQIFNMSRSFYIIVKLVSEKLSDENGFCLSERKSHYMTLINFTEFSLLRLIMVTTQFMNYHSSSYLRSNVEFKDAIEESGLAYNLY